VAARPPETLRSAFATLELLSANSRRHGIVAEHLALAAAWHTVARAGILPILGAGDE